MGDRPLHYVAAVREEPGWRVVYYGELDEGSEWVRARALELLNGPHLGLVVVPEGPLRPGAPLDEAIMAYQSEHPEVTSGPDGGLEVIGPFTGDSHYVLSVDGYKVPYVTLFLQKGTEDMWAVHLDDRMVWEMNDDALRQSAGLLAHAMAIAAGFGAHGRAASFGPRNRHSSRMMSVTGTR